MPELSKLEKKLDLKFKDLDYLRQALVHRSYINEHPEFKLGHNERLEFLGDAVLELIITEYLFINFANRSEGELTNWRASLVNSRMLYEVAKEIEIEEFVYLSKGEEKDKSAKARQFILADTVEAIIGGLYLDQGIEPVKKFIHSHMVSKLDSILAQGLHLDPKSTFQEMAQEKEGITPHYESMNETGPDHSKEFTVGAYLNKELIAEGKGSSKQEAQIHAAQKSLETKGW